LVNGVIKSDGMTATATATATGKLFADDGTYMKVMRFLDIFQIMESCHA
jgi:hypothetical protein